MAGKNFFVYSDENEGKNTRLLIITNRRVRYFMYS